MKTGLNRAIAALGIVVALLVTGAAVAFALTSGSAPRRMVGVVVSPSNAGLTVADQPGASRTLHVAALKVPGPSWVVVHLDENGKPGMRIGLAHVDAGAGRADVALKSAPTTEKLIVALHADRGTLGRFDFAMDHFDTSADKPYFVNGTELAREVAVR